MRNSPLSPVLYIYVGATPIIVRTSAELDVWPQPPTRVVTETHPLSDLSDRGVSLARSNSLTPYALLGRSSPLRLYLHGSSGLWRVAYIRCDDAISKRSN